MVDYFISLGFSENDSIIIVGFLFGLLTIFIGWLFSIIYKWIRRKFSKVEDDDDYSGSGGHLPVSLRRYTDKTFIKKGDILDSGTITLNDDDYDGNIIDGGTA